MEDAKQYGAVSWKIEKTVSKGDYTYAVVREHPRRSKHGYVLEHRVVMENHLGRLLNPNEIVHHINADKKDNRLENLEVMSTSYHAKLHASTGRQMAVLKCPWCAKLFTREKNQTFLNKPYRYTTCSKSCAGKFSRKIQLGGETVDVERAISANLVRLYKRDNAEETPLTEDP